MSEIKQLRKSVENLKEYRTKYKKLRDQSYEVRKLRQKIKNLKALYRIRNGENELKELENLRIKCTDQQLTINKLNLQLERPTAFKVNSDACDEFAKLQVKLENALSEAKIHRCNARQLKDTIKKITAKSADANTKLLLEKSEAAKEKWLALARSRAIEAQQLRQKLQRQTDKVLHVKALLGDDTLEFNDDIFQLREKVIKLEDHCKALKISNAMKDSKIKNLQSQLIALAASDLEI
jgi:hypothetical protein